uniref:Uncharacterized protein n=1 Tax=Arundo donax TaxID=35708 RepID=A0A0A9FGN6_ARUDO
MVVGFSGCGAASVMRCILSSPAGRCCSSRRSWQRRRRPRHRRPEDKTIREIRQVWS